MKKILIYGASDDTIVVAGDILAEGSPRHDEPGYVFLDTGDVFGVGFEADGIWRINPVVKTGKLSVVDLKLPVGDDYSEVAHVEGEFESIYILQSWPVDDEELKDLLEEAIEKSTVRGRIRIPRERLIAAIEAITGKPLGFK